MNGETLCSIWNFGCVTKVGLAPSIFDCLLCRLTSMVSCRTLRRSFIVQNCCRVSLVSIKLAGVTLEGFV